MQCLLWVYCVEKLGLRSLTQTGAAQIRKPSDSSHLYVPWWRCQYPVLELYFMLRHV